MLDEKQLYNVWDEGNGNKQVLTMPVTQVTAEALAALLSYECKVPKGTVRFVAKRPVTDPRAAN